MISLAPIKYRNILAPQKGPISHIITTQIDGGPKGSLWESHAYLTECYSSKRVLNYQIERPDGTGTSPHKSISIYKAISESLERWAYTDCQLNNKNEYGFNIDRSTNGMACFPGLFKANSRQIARLEAIERWALINWWTNKLDHRIINSDEIFIIEIIHPFKDANVVILKKRCDFGYAYGFAAGKTLSLAINKAADEVSRNERMLEILSTNQDKLVIDLQDRRIMYFSSEAGHQTFINRVNNRRQCDSKLNRCKLIIDDEIIGLWSQYGCVWRCLIDGEYHQAYNTDDERFFFF